MMIVLNQPRFKSFAIYVFGFVFCTLFIYLAIPFFFDYKNYNSSLEKKIFEDFGLKLDFTTKADYNFFPSPRLKLKNVKVLSLEKDSKKNVGEIDKLILKIPFKKLTSLRKLDFYNMELVNAGINVDVLEINNFKNFFNNPKHEKPIQLKKSKINLLDKNNLLFTIDLKKFNILGLDYQNKINLEALIFNTKLKLNYNNKYPQSNVSILLPEIGLNIKIKSNIKEKNSQNNFGRVNISFPNNQLFLDYQLDDKIMSISSSKLINTYFKGKFYGELIFFPFFTFDINLDMNTLKFPSLINSRMLAYNFLEKIIPINNKFNGEVNVKIEEITSSSNIINSGNINLEFRNGVLVIKSAQFSMDKIGEIILNGSFLKSKKKEMFNYETKINIKDSKVLYSRFLIPKKNRIDLKPITIVGKVDLKSYEIKIEKIYFTSESTQVELGKNEVLNLEEKINEILQQNSLENVLKYSNLRKIIQSFFIMN